jgi:hypothetical protein
MTQTSLKYVRLLAAVITATCAGTTLSSGTGYARGSSKPLKVFILSGQSNMQGHAHVRTLEALALDPKAAPLLRTLRAKDGSPRVYQDVWISYLSSDGEKHGRLSIGFGADGNKMGPELTFGITMQELLGEPILLIKTAWGGKSLHTDFRSPSAGPSTFTAAQRKRLEQQGKDLAEAQAERAQATGHYYRLMMEHVKQVLADVKKVHPAYSERRGYELAGFVWFQGWNDMVDRDTYPQRDKPGGYDLYSRLMAQFIHDVRHDLGAPQLPFIIGVLGVGGPTEQFGPDQMRHKAVHQNFRDAMAAPAKDPALAKGVVAVLTERYWDTELSTLRARDAQIREKVRKQRGGAGLDPKEERAEVEKQREAAFSTAERELLEKGISNQDYHYLGSAKIMARIGQAFAEALHRVMASATKK